MLFQLKFFQHFIKKRTEIDIKKNYIIFLAFFRLVDFGLAQRTGEPGLAPEVTKIRTPQCKRKLTSSDLANSMESPPSASHYSKKRRVTHPSGERGANRKVLSELYVLI